MLVGALGQEVVAHTGATQEEAVPGLADGGNDAFVALGAYFYLMDTLGQAHVQREADGLGAIVDENSADGHVYLLLRMYIAIVYCAAGAVYSALSNGFCWPLINTLHEQSH